MWLVTVFGICCLISFGIASDFFINTAGGCDPPLFHRHHGSALLNHVIKTLPLFLADCMTECQKTLDCFSINYYYKNQSLMCDLNRSTKTQDPGSFVRMSGYEYAEAEKKMYCEESKCHSKEALQGDWFRLDTSKFKFIPERKSWQDSEQHCQTLGAKLASFESQLENRFVLQTINMTSTANTTTASVDTPTTPPSGGSSGGSTPLVAVKMDGTDPSGTLSLFNGAAVVDIDGKKAVYFEGVDDYATVPRFEITGSLTIAFWVKAQDPVANKWLFSDFASNKQMFRIYVSLGKISFSLHDTGGGFIVFNLKSTSDFPINVWLHVAITWDSSTKEAKVFFDANPEASKISSASDLTSYQTGNQHFEIGAKSAGTIGQLKGWIRELYVTAKALSQAEITEVKDNGLPGGPAPGPTQASAEGGAGTWVGLNDVATERKYQWSDGTPLSYSQLMGSDNTAEKNCVYLPKDGDISSKWVTAECTQKKPFLCKKK